MWLQFSRNYLNSEQKKDHTVKRIKQEKVSKLSDNLENLKGGERSCIIEKESA